MSDIEIGRAKRGRRAYAFDDIAIVPSRRTRDPQEALATLFARDRQHVFLEGGPTLARAFLGAGLVDEVVTYVAPMLLGAGASAVADLGIGTIADARHLPREMALMLAKLRAAPVVSPESKSSES